MVHVKGIFFVLGIMPSNKENSGRSGKRKASAVSSTTDNDEDYRTRRNKNNEVNRIILYSGDIEKFCAIK